MVGKIYFTQYLFPDGRKKLVSIEAPDHIVKAADAIIGRGFRFECEILSTDHVSVTISDDDDDYAIELCQNDESVHKAVERLITSFDLSKAIKQRSEYV